MSRDPTTGADLSLVPLHDWVASRGLCASTMPTGHDPHYDEHRPRGRYGPRTQRQRARAACHGCPVQAQCLELALRHERATGASWGYWGGTSPGERGAMIAEREHIDDIATDVLRVLADVCGEGANLDALPARARERLVVLGLVLTYHLREDAYFLPQVVLSQALTPWAAAHHRGPRVALAQAG